MTLEEIKQLSDDALGRRLSALTDVYAIYPPDLCERLNRIAEVEKIVIDKGLGSIYAQNLNLVLAKTTDIPLIYKYHLITATARQRAEACLLTLTNKEAK